MIFITGVSGFIGSNLANFLHLEGHPIVGIDIGPNCPGFLAKDGHFYQGSTSDSALLSTIFESHNIETVLHLGMTSTPKSAKENPENAKESIVSSTDILLNLSHEHSVNNFVFFSSSHVYGDVGSDKVSEADASEPKSFYGKLKWEAELNCRTFGKNDEVTTRVHIVRPTSVYGPNDPEKRVVNKFIEKALNNEAITINNTTSRLDFTYIDDFVQGIDQLLKANLETNETFNLSRGQGRTLLELGEILNGIFPQLEIQIDEESQRDATKKGCLDISKAKSFFGYNPQVDLESGVEKILKKRN